MKKLLALVFLMAGCGGPKPGEAPSIDFGRQECSACGMIVSEQRFASGYVRDGGESAAFDDLGELLSELDARPELKARAWVQDMNGRGWLPLSQAHLVNVPGLATPMGSGWIAFADKQSADSFKK